MRPPVGGYFDLSCNCQINAKNHSKIKRLLCLVPYGVPFHPSITVYGLVRQAKARCELPGTKSVLFRKQLHLGWMVRIHTDVAELAITPNHAQDHI